KWQSTELRCHRWGRRGARTSDRRVGCGGRRLHNLFTQPHPPIPALAVWCRVLTGRSGTYPNRAIGSEGDGRAFARRGVSPWRNSHAENDIHVDGCVVVVPGAGVAGGGAAAAGFEG